ncbi:tetratricopeptide repeat protein [Microbulbifer sp. ALW1]|uniref:tetratricopeptide repeat protein n=1 Tax=Microbulbifer sp. (strain ALW1) TaxID=1516059 RepID=UPI00135675C8|nr:tetratricopeptide repeat protein [Microbulbifer sp. ALW1]
MINIEKQEALQRLRKFWEQDRENPLLTQDLLSKYFETGALDQGREFIDALPESVLGFPSVSHSAGMLCLAVSDYRQAEFCFRWADAKAPGQLAIQYNLAYTMFQQHQYAEAETILQSIAEPTAEVLVLKARADHHLGKFDHAIDALDAAIALDGDLQASGLLALVYNDCGSREKAIELAEMVLEQEPHQFEALLAMADAYTALQSYAEASRWCDMGLTEYPSVGRFWTVKGQLQLVDFDFNEARASFTKAVELMPEHIGTWHLLGWSEVLRDDLGAALHAFERALELNRNFAESHGGLAVVNALQGNWDTAQQASKRALGLDHSNLSGRYAEALCLEHRGQAGAAEQLRQKLFATPTGQKVENKLPEMVQKYLANRGEQL